MYTTTFGDVFGENAVNVAMPNCFEYDNKSYPKQLIYKPIYQIYFNVPCQQAPAPVWCEPLMIKVVLLYIVPKGVHSLIGISTTVSKD